jgi:hypothetical protein
MNPGVIVLEFNELSPMLMDRFIGEGRLPNFARLRASALVATTDAEEQPPALEPWIQWVTIHTGLSFREHGVFSLDDGAKLDRPRVWDVVSAAGAPVWVCGSMNASHRGEALNGWLLPDPWSSQRPPVPDTLQPFFRLVSAYVQEHAHPGMPLSLADHAKFAAFMLAHGLSPRTVSETIAQLSRELGGDDRWRRATILDRLQWDLFRSGYRKLKPRFATFFANSTAHFQHYHWREMEPDRFAIRPTPDDETAYGEAIRFGYEKMDRLVGECLDLAGPETTVVLCTALSQQPMTEYDSSGGKQVFKTRIEKLAQYLGLPQPYSVTPVMAEEFRLRFGNDEAAEVAEQKLASLRMTDGAPAMRVRREGSSLLAGCAAIAAPPANARVVAPSRNLDIPFDDLFHALGRLKSGRHHPDGILWIRAPGLEPGQLARKVRLTELAPTFLALCGLPASGVFPQPAMPELAGAPIAASLAQVA